MSEADPLTPCGWWVLGPLPDGVGPAVPGLREQGAGLWRDIRALSPDALIRLAGACYSQCADFIDSAYDRLARGPGPGHQYKMPHATPGDPGGTYRLYAWQVAQIRQMQASWRTSLAQAGGEVGSEEFRIVVYPMSKEIKEMLRPPARVPYFGGAE